MTGAETAGGGHVPPGIAVVEEAVLTESVVANEIDPEDDPVRNLIESVETGDLILVNERSLPMRVTEIGSWYDGVKLTVEGANGGEVVFRPKTEGGYYTSPNIGIVRYFATVDKQI